MSHCRERSLSDRGEYRHWAEARKLESLTEGDPNAPLDLSVKQKPSPCSEMVMLLSLLEEHATWRGDDVASNDRLWKNARKKKRFRWISPKCLALNMIATLLLQLSLYLAGLILFGPRCMSDVSQPQILIDQLSFVVIPSNITDDEGRRICPWTSPGSLPAKGLHAGIQVSDEGPEDRKDSSDSPENDGLKDGEIPHDDLSQGAPPPRDRPIARRTAEPRSAEPSGPRYNTTPTVAQNSEIKWGVLAGLSIQDLIDLTLPTQNPLLKLPSHSDTNFLPDSFLDETITANWEHRDGNTIEEYLAKYNLKNYTFQGTRSREWTDHGIRVGCMFRVRVPITMLTRLPVMLQAAYRECGIFGLAKPRPGPTQGGRTDDINDRIALVRIGWLNDMVNVTREETAKYLHLQGIIMIMDDHYDLVGSLRFCVSGYMQLIVRSDVLKVYMVNGRVHQWPLLLPHLYLPCSFNG